MTILEFFPWSILNFVQNLEFSLGTILEFYQIFRGQIVILSNWRAKPKISKIHNYTRILAIIHPQFYPESRIMLQGPLCNFFKVWRLNCNFPKLRDQTEISSSSTSTSNSDFSIDYLNISFPTYCFIKISNSNSLFKQIITQIIILTYNLSKSTK